MPGAGLLFAVAVMDLLVWSVFGAALGGGAPVSDADDGVFVGDALALFASISGRR